MAVSSVRPKTKKRSNDSAPTVARKRHTKQHHQSKDTVDETQDEDNREEEEPPVDEQSYSSEDNESENQGSHGNSLPMVVKAQLEQMAKELHDVKERCSSQEQELQNLRSSKNQQGESPNSQAVKLMYAQMKRLSDFIRDDLFHDIKIVDPRFNSEKSEVMQVLCKEIGVTKQCDMIKYKNAVYRLFCKQMGQRQNYIAQRCRKVYHGMYYEVRVSCSNSPLTVTCLFL